MRILSRAASLFALAVMMASLVVSATPRLAYADDKEDAEFLYAQAVTEANVAFSYYSDATTAKGAADVYADVVKRFENNEFAIRAKIGNEQCLELHGLISGYKINAGSGRSAIVDGDIDWSAADAYLGEGDMAFNAGMFADAKYKYQNAKTKYYLAGSDYDFACQSYLEAVLYGEAADNWLDQIGF